MYDKKIDETEIKLKSSFENKQVHGKPSGRRRLLYFWANCFGCLDRDRNVYRHGIDFY